MKLLVTGGRKYDDWTTLSTALTRLHTHRPITLLIQGFATGVDTMSAHWAGLNGIEVDGLRPNWRYGGYAGNARNAAMLTRFKPDAVLSFPGGTGTIDMRLRTKEAGIELLTWRDALALT